jgi:hypothetical protein
MNDIDLKSEKTKKWVQYGLFALAAFLFGPIALITVTGGIGLIVMLVIALFTVNVLIPWVSMAAKNWRLKALKAEAAKNPIETLQNEYLRRKQQILDYRNKVRTFAAEVKNFGDHVAGFKRDYPDESASFDEKFNKMNELLRLRKAKYERAQQGLKDYEKSIDKFKRKWEVAQAAQRLDQTAGAINDEFIGKLMTETAIDSVQKSMNEAFAELDLALVDESAEAAGERKKVAITSEPVTDTKQLVAGGNDDTIDLCLGEILPEAEKVLVKR